MPAIFALRKLFKNRNLKFSIAHRAKSVYVALLATDKPVVGVYHAFGTHSRKSRQLLANIFRKRLFIVGVSNAVRDDIRGCLPSWPENKIQTFYNRINIEALESGHLSKERSREKLGISHDAWVVGNVGRLHPDKDQKTLIKDFALFVKSQSSNNFLLVIAGSGRLESDLRKLADELSIADKVVFLGQVKNFKKYFKAFDLFVLSSDREPFGMVVLEAMVAQIPLIVSNCGGAPEVLGNFGEKFEFGNEEDLCSKMLNLYKSPQALSDPIAYLEANFSDRAAVQRKIDLLRVFGF